MLAQVFPNEIEELLIHAAFSPGQRCIQAWEDWTRRIDLDDVDIRSFQLLPLLYKNLSLQGIASPIVARLKGVYRQAWYKNMLRIREMQEIVQTLQSHGIDSMVCHDAASALYYYEDFACCPIRTIDVEVQQTVAAEAMKWLTTIGWQSRLADYNRVVAYRNWLPFTNSSGLMLHLYWRLSVENIDSTDSIEMNIPSTLSGGAVVRVSLMSPAEQLFYIFIDGLKHKGDRGVRWVVDALTLIHKSNASIDWGKLVDMAVAMEKVIPVKHCCRYLKKTFGLTLPDEEMVRLERAPTSKSQEIEWQVRLGGAKGVSLVLKKFVNHVSQYLRARKHESVIGKIKHYPQYLQCQWEVGTITSVPGQYVRRGMQTFFKAGEKA